jgi:archaellum component FlaC
VTVTGQGSVLEVEDDLGTAWLRVGELMNHRQACVDARFDRLDASVAGLKTDVAGLKTDVAGLKTDVAGLKTDVAGLKTDVAGLKTDVAGLKTDMAGVKAGLAETKEQLGRLERASERQFSRLEARLEHLIGLVERNELRG